MHAPDPVRRRDWDFTHVLPDFSYDKLQTQPSMPVIGHTCDLSVAWLSEHLKGAPGLGGGGVGVSGVGGGGVGDGPHGILAQHVSPDGHSRFTLFGHRAAVAHLSLASS